MAYQHPHHNFSHPYQNGSQPNGQSYDSPILYPQVVIPMQPRGVTDNFQQLPQDARSYAPAHAATLDGAQTGIAYSQYPAAVHQGHVHTFQTQTPPMVNQQATHSALQNPAYPIDYQLLLLTLADEYLAAAHDQGSAIAISQHEQDINEYHKLVATSLGCMEALLKKSRLQPLVEAKVRLKYAQVLHEETENLLEAETVLTKGIDLCERNRFVDLKYAMQALLVWILSRSNTKAALKAADGMIEDVQAYRQAAWEYVFRFRCASLATSGSSQQELATATHHLQKICALSEQNGDKVIFFTAAIMEGFTHLQSGGPESTTHAQRTLAKARQLQLEQEIQGIAQLQIMTLLLDLACSLYIMDTESATKKMQTLQSLYDHTISASAWAPDGAILLPLSPRSLNGVSLHGQGNVQIKDGRPCLRLEWLTRGEVYVLCNLCNASAISYKNSTDGHKAEQFLSESIRSLSSDDGPQAKPAASVARSRRMLLQKNILKFHCLIQLALLQASRGDWTSAQQHHKDATSLQRDLPDSPPSTTAIPLLKYLEGILAQGTGDLNHALTIYQHPSLSLNRSFPKTATSHITRDLSILSACNTILIIYQPTHPSHHLINTLLPLLLPYHQPQQSPHHPPSSSSPGPGSSPLPRLLLSTLSLTLSLLPPTSLSTLKTKQHLSQSLNLARALSHNQLQTLTLALMSNRFFKGVVGEQADKAGRAGKAMAGKWGNPMWVGVTGGVVAEGLEMRGLRAEAEKVWREVERVEVPVGVRRAAAAAAGAAGGGAEEEEQQEARDE